MILEKKRYILRERKSTDRLKEHDFVMLKLEERGGRVSICGIEGYSLKKRDARIEEKEWPGGEVILLRSRRVYFAEGIGQCIDKILDFFPEMRPYMDRHMQQVQPEDARWLTKKFRGAREVMLAELEGGWR